LLTDLKEDLDKSWTLPKTPWEKDLFRPKNGIFEPQNTLVGKEGEESITIREKPENMQLTNRSFRRINGPRNHLL
jgi:hypothetical protein